MDIVMPKVGKDGNLVSSVSPGKREGGIHPVTKLTIRNCICSSPLCRQLMWILASIDARQYFPYVRLPNKPKQGEKSTVTKDHVNACRKNHFHHLHGYGEEGSASKRALDGKNELFVALIHYPEKIRECIQTTPDGLAKQFKFRVPLDIGRACGLTDLDLCPTTNENGERTYFTSPTQSNVSEGTDIWNEVAVLVREHNNKCNPTPTENNTENVATIRSSGPRPNINTVATPSITMASKSGAGSAFHAVASSLCELGISIEEAKKKEDNGASQEEPTSNHNVQEFFQNVWQTQPAIFRSCQNACVDKECSFYKAVHMKWDDVAQMLHHCRESSSHAPLFFQNGNPVTDPATTYANNPHAAYLDGCSIIVNHADFHHPVIANLCTNLQQTFPHVYANTYLSPPDSHAVNAHADDRDVLVVQLLGSKTWKVYRKVPIQYPFQNEQVGKNGLEVDPSVFAGGLCFDDKEITLSAGDVLYMPRGFVHEASTHTQNAPMTTDEPIEPSFHITLALATHDWCIASILSDTIRKTLIDNPQFRKALPIGPCSEYGGSQYDADTFLQQQMDSAMSLIQRNITSGLLHEQLTNKYNMHNSRADELRQNITSRKRPIQDLTEDNRVGYHAACRVTLDSVVRASSTEERSSVVLDEGRLRGLTVREETMQFLMTIIGLMKEKPSMESRVKELRNIATADESICSNPMICDFTLLSFARCCVELGALAIVAEA